LNRDSRAKKPEAIDADPPCSNRDTARRRPARASTPGGVTIVTRRHSYRQAATVNGLVDRDEHLGGFTSHRSWPAPAESRTFRHRAQWSNTGRRAERVRGGAGAAGRWGTSRPRVAARAPWRFRGVSAARCAGDLCTNETKGRPARPRTGRPDDHRVLVNDLQPQGLLRRAVSLIAPANDDLHPPGGAKAN